MGRFKGIVYLTQAQYAALEPKDEDTLYCINDKNVPIPTVADINKVVRVNAFGQYELAASPISDKQIFDINHPVNSEYQTSVETDMSTLSDGTWELVYHGNVGGEIVANDNLAFYTQEGGQSFASNTQVKVYSLSGKISPTEKGVFYLGAGGVLRYGGEGLKISGGVTTYIYKRIA